MSSAVPGGRPVVLTLPCNPPSAASSVYAVSEASADSAAASSTATFASNNSTIGCSFSPDDSVQASHGQLSTSYEHGNASPITIPGGAPLPLLQLEDGDTLIYLNPPSSAVSRNISSSRMSPTYPPLKVLSSRLLSTGSPVFHQLFSPGMQQRIFNRLVKQKKALLAEGKLPKGIQFVLDLTPEDEGEKAVEWQERLWCPDIVLHWKSNLVALNPIQPAELENDVIARRLDEFRQTQWGGAKSPVEGTTSPTSQLISPQVPALPDAYSFNRHILSLERLVHILHGIDPVVQSTVDWYTLHCLSVAFGTTDATQDYTARWIFSNPLIIENHPAFIWQVAVEAGLATIASDAFAAAVMRYTFDEAEANKVPGAPDAAAALAARVKKEFIDLFALDWINQYLPPTPPASDDDGLEHFETSRFHLRNFILRRMKISSGIVEMKPGDVAMPDAMTRRFWEKLQGTILSSTRDARSPPRLDSVTLYDLWGAINSWRLYEKSAVARFNSGNDDLWADVRLRVPHHPVASIPQLTMTEGQQSYLDYDPSMDDAESEMETVRTEVDGQRNIYTAKNSDRMEICATEDVPEKPVSNLISPIGDRAPSLDPMQEEESTTVHGAPKDVLDMVLDQGESGGANEPGVHAQPIHKSETDGGQATNEPLNQSSYLFPESDPLAPRWLQEQLADLSENNEPAHFWALMHHPNHDQSKPTEPRIRCLDCPEMLYFPGPGETLNNFSVHLRNAQHMSRVQTRQLSGDIQTLKDPGSFPDTFAATQSKAQNVRDGFAMRPSLPVTLLPILRCCETYIESKCLQMTARNIVFEPEMLEGQLACLEEGERAFMPLWAGGEAVPNGNCAAKSSSGAGSSTVNENMSVNVSSVGVDSACAMSTTASTSSFVEVLTPEGSIADGSVISLSEDGSEVSGNKTPPDEDDDDWVVDDGEEGESFEYDDDIYFQ